jgi:hypothetical protein|tara:strand:+ start:19922 stop:20056 length:135 start_codon:yes stop_codon:yes gene_type:complete
LVKVLTNFLSNKKKTTKTKVGQITEDFIQDARQDLEQQKQKMSN